MKVSFSKTQDVTPIFKKTENKIFQNTKVFAALIHNSKGLFAEKLHPRKHLGQEIAEYVKSFRYGGFVHSDEKHTPVELKKLRVKLKAKSTDLLVLAAGDRQVISLIKERLKQLSHGVSEDTRKANADGFTAFLRPLPTGARMYPETDILPFKLPLVDSLERPEDRLAKLKKIMPHDIANKLCMSPEYYIFKRLGRVPILGVVLTNYLPALRRKGIEISEEHLKELLRLYKLNRVPKDGLMQALGDIAKGESVDLDEVNPDEVRAFVKELIIKKKSYILSSPDPIKGLMGLVMKKYRGKLPGKWISIIIREELEAIK